jgi:hypothetical protein
MLTLMPDGSFTYVPNTWYVGGDSFTYDVSNGTSTSGTARVTLDVMDTPHELESGFTDTVNQSLSGPIADTTIDPGGHALTFYPSLNDALFPDDGSLTMTTDGWFTFTPNPGFVGIEQLNFTVYNGTNYTSLYNTINVQNPPDPGVVANNATFTTAVGQTLTKSLRGDVADDSRGLLTFEPVKDPNDGTLQLNTDGTFSYTPDAQFAGSDSFQYEFSDGTIHSNVATARIDVENQALVAGNASYMAGINSSFSGTLAGDVSDSISGTPTFHLVNGAGTGNLTLLSNGSFTYVPATQFVGADSFSYDITDGLATSNLATLTFRITGDDGYARDDSYVATVGQTLYGTLSGDAAGNITGQAVTYCLAGSASHGTVTLNSDGTFSYVPTSGYAGPDSFGFYYSDNGVFSQVATVSISVAFPETTPTAPIQATGFTMEVGASDDNPIAASSVDEWYEPNGTMDVVHLVSPPSHGSVWLAGSTVVYYPRYPVTAGVEDSFSYYLSNGTINSNVATATVYWVPPTAGIETYGAPWAGSDSFTDRVGQTLTQSLTDDTNKSIFDETGSGLAFHLVNYYGPGTVTLSAGGDLVYTPPAQFSGVDVFTYDVTDAGISSAVATVWINVRNQPLVADNEWYTTPAEVAESATLPVDQSNPRGSSYAFYEVVGPANGSVTLARNGAFTYKPNYYFSVHGGQDSFSYFISNGTTTSNVATVYISFIGELPQAPNTAYTDPLGQTLSRSLNGVGYDPLGRPITYQLVGNPRHGTVSLSGNGAFWYSPNAQFVGQDSFTYEVLAGTAVSDVGAVTIDVPYSQQTPPQASNAQFTDGVGMPLTASLANDAVGQNGDPVTFGILTQPHHGVIAMGTNGLFTYTPESGFQGIDSFAYFVNDGATPSLPATVMIDVEDEPPIADNLSISDGAVHTLSGSLTGLVSNPAGDPLTFFLVNQATNGTAVVATDGSFTYSPDYGYGGIDTFTYDVSNGSFLSNVATVTIDVQLPYLGVVSTLFQDGYEHVLNASLAGFSLNPDGLSFVYNQVRNASHGTVSIGPDGSLRYIPFGSYVGIDTFAYDISSGSDVSNTVVDTIRVLGPPNPEDATVVVDEYNQQINGSLAADVSDSDGSTRYYLVAGPNSDTFTFNSDGTYTYTPPPGFIGTDSFSFYVSEGTFTSNPATVTISVLGPPEAEAAQFTTMVNAPLSNSLASDATAPEGRSISFGLTGQAANGNVVLNSDGSFTYTPYEGFAGVDRFTYLVSDGTTVSSVATVSIDVQGYASGSAPPLVRGDSFATIRGVSLTATLAGNAVDPQGGTLSFSLVTQAGNGQVVLNSDGTFIYTPNTAYVGDDTFSYDVTNGTSPSAAAVVQIDVQDPATVRNPALQVLPASFTAVAGQEYDNSIAGDASGPPGATLSYAVDAQASNGSVILHPDGTFRYFPDQGYYGPDSFSYYVTDGTSASYDAIVALDVRNPASDRSSALQAQGDAFTVQGGGVLTWSLAGDASGPPNDPLTFALDAQARYGNVVLDSEGGFVYTPDSGYSGPDSFTYYVSDGTLASYDAIVTIDVRNPTPSEYPPPQVQNLWETTQMGGGVFRYLSAYDPNPDAGALIYSVSTAADGTVDVYSDYYGTFFTYTPNPDFAGEDSFTYSVSDGTSISNTATVTITVVAPSNQPGLPQAQNTWYSTPYGQPLDGSLPVEPASSDDYFSLGSPGNGTVMLHDLRGSSFTYTPDPGFYGEDSFSYTVYDQYGDSTATVFVDVQNPPDTTFPIDAENVSYTIPQGQELDSSISATDPSGGRLTYSAGNVSDGTLTFNPDGTFSYTPNDGFEGVDSFSYSATDGTSTSTAAVYIAVQDPNNSNPPNPPPLAANAFLTTAYGQEADGSVDASDPDGGPLTFSAGGAGDGTLSFNPDGTFSYVPNPGFYGQDSFDYSVTDDTGASSSATVWIDVGYPPIPTPPQASNAWLTTVMGQEVSGSLPVNDPSGGTLTYSHWDVSDGTLTFNSDGTFSYVPNPGFAGEDSFTYEATDGTDPSNTATVYIDVEYPANLPPAPQAQDLWITATENQAVAGSVSVADPSGGALSYNFGTPTTGTVTPGTDGSFTYQPNQWVLGEDSFTYSASDGTTTSNTATVFIDIVADPANPANLPPVVSDAAFTTTENQALDNTLAGDATDPDDLPYTFVVVASAGHGVATLNSDGTFSYTPNQGYLGPDSFSYYIDDGLQRSNVSIVSIEVHAPAGPLIPAPVAGSASFATPADQPLQNSLSAYASDTAGLSYSFDLADDASHGHVQLDPDGTFTYTPIPGYVGPDSFSYSINDDSLESNVSIVTIEVQPAVNDSQDAAPLAGGDAFATPVGQEFDGSLADDAVGASGDTLTFRLVTDAGNGHAAVNGDGSFTYVPDAGYSGPDSFTYDVSDGTQTSNVAVVTIDVQDAAGGADSPPVAQDDGFSTDTGQALTTSLAGDASGSPGAVLDFSLVDQAQNGTAVLSPEGQLHYIPNGSFTGTDSFTYEVNDGSLQSNVATVVVTVTAPSLPPQANDDSYSIAHGQTLTVGAAAGVLSNDTDSAGLTLAVVPETTATAQGGTVTLNADGSFTYTPPAQFHGSDWFTYQDDDGSQPSNTATVTVAVTESAPVAGNVSYTVPDGPSLDVWQHSVLLSDTDADGDVLTVMNTSLPTHGTLDFPGNGLFIYTPDAGYTGTDSFQYEAWDGLEASNPATVTINVTNKPPTAQGATYTVPDVATTIADGSGVLAAATDPYGYTLTAVKVAGPTDGTLALDSAGGFIYTPDAGYTGPDRFTFYAFDGVNRSATATVTLEIEDAPPSPGPVQQDGSAYTFAVQPGGTTSWSAAAGVLSAATDPYGYSMTASLVTQPAHGTLSLGSDGSFTYTPTTGFTGTDTFTYHVGDGTYTSDPATVTINVGNDELPVADMGAAYGYAVPTNDVLTTSSTDGVLGRASDPYGYGMTASLVDGPSHGTLTLNSDGSFTYTPNAGYSGTDQFTYRAFDGLNDSPNTTVMIAVDSTELPTADAGTPYSYAVQPGATLTTTPANGLLSDATDPYGESLTAVPDSTLSDGAVTLNADGSFTYATGHSTLVVNPDGSFTYTPASGFTGTESFTYRATDGTNESAPDSFTIDVTPTASPGGDSSGGGTTDPTDESSGDVSDPAPVAEDASYTIAPDETLLTPTGQGVLANDSDPDGKTLIATLVQDVSSGTLTLQADGLFSYTPNPGFSGTDSFTYDVSDGTYTSATPGSVTITVTAAALPGTNDGGVGFNGVGDLATGTIGSPGSLAYEGYDPAGGAYGTSATPGGVPDNFTPTFHGPGLDGPGVYAAGANDGSALGDGWYAVLASDGASDLATAPVYRGGHEPNLSGEYSELAYLSLIGDGGMWEYPAMGTPDLAAYEDSGVFYAALPGYGVLLNTKPDQVFSLIDGDLSAPYTPGIYLAGGYPLGPGSASYSDGGDETSVSWDTSRGPDGLSGWVSGSGSDNWGDNSQEGSWSESWNDGSLVSDDSTSSDSYDSPTNQNSDTYSYTWSDGAFSATESGVSTVEDDQGNTDTWSWNASRDNSGWSATEDVDEPYASSWSSGDGNSITIDSDDSYHWQWNGNSAGFAVVETASHDYQSITESSNTWDGTTSESSQSTSWSDSGVFDYHTFDDAGTDTSSSGGKETVTGQYTSTESSTENWSTGGEAIGITTTDDTWGNYTGRFSSGTISSPGSTDNSSNWSDTDSSGERSDYLNESSESTADGTLSNTYHAWTSLGDSSHDSGSDDDSNGVNNGSTQYVQNDTGKVGYDATNAPNAETFRGPDNASGVETPLSDVGDSIQFTDQATVVAETNDNDTTTTEDATYTDNGTDYSITDDQGSDSFNETTGDLSSGSGTQVGGAASFGLHDQYVDHFSDLSTTHNVGDNEGNLESNATTTHSDHGDVDWSWGLQGNDTFTMQASDADTGDTSWDIGAENDFQTQSLTGSFTDSSSETYDGGLTLESWSSDANGGSDTLSTGDTVDHNYGVVAVDPTTGDTESDTGPDLFTLGKTYSDTYTNTSSGTDVFDPSTTHTDSGFGGETYTDQGTETSVTTTTDPDTGDFSADRNTDTYSENDASTESFTDQNSVSDSLGSDDTFSDSTTTSHTDNGFDTVATSDQVTDVATDTSNSGLSSGANSDTLNEWDSSSDSYSDQASHAESGVGSAATADSSTTHTDSGSDTVSANDQGTDTSSDGSSDGLNADSAFDSYTNTESASDSYSDQSSDSETTVGQSVVAVGSSESSTDSGIDTSWSSDSGTSSETEASEDGLESDSGSDTYTNTESSSDGYGDQSSASDSEVGGWPVTAASSDSHTDSGTDTTWSTDYGTDFPSFAAQDGTASDDSSTTSTDTETSGDTYSDQSSDSETGADGVLVSATSSETSSETDTDTSGDVENGVETTKTPTDDGSEFVTTTSTETDTSSDSETDTSTDTSDDQQGSDTGTDGTTSDGTGTESTTETSSGTESFDGIQEDDADYSGSGGFTETLFDSTTYSNHDDSNTSTDPADLLNGTDTSNDSDYHSWNHYRQDTDSVSGDGDEEPVTLVDQDYGTKTTQATPSTTYNAGVATQQGGTTDQTDETHSVTEGDLYSDVTTDDSTNTTGAAPSGAGDSGSRAAAQYGATPAGGSSGPNTTTIAGAENGAGKAVQAAGSNQSQMPTFIQSAGEYIGYIGTVYVDKTKENISSAWTGFSGVFVGLASGAKELALQASDVQLAATELAVDAANYAGLTDLELRFEPTSNFGRLITGTYQSGGAPAVQSVAANAYVQHSLAPINLGLKVLADEWAFAAHNDAKGLSEDLGMVAGIFVLDFIQGAVIPAAPAAAAAAKGEIALEQVAVAESAAATAAEGEVVLEEVVVAESAAAAAAGGEIVVEGLTVAESEVPVILEKIVEEVAPKSGFPTKPGGTGAAYNEATGQGVYVLRNRGIGQIEYVGRGDAPARLAEHAKPGSGNEDLVGEILFNNNLPANQARSLEQELMQMLGGPKSTNPSSPLRNKIQGIGEGNPQFLELEFAADDALVIETLRRAGLL